MRLLLPSERTRADTVFGMKRWRFQPPEHDRVETIQVAAKDIVCTCALWEKEYPRPCYEIQEHDEPAIMADVAHYEEFTGITVSE